MFKTCFRCKLQKSFLDFHKRPNNRRFKDGLYTYCKSCKSVEDKQYRQKYRKIINQKKKAYFQKPLVKKYRKIYINNWTKNRRKQRLDIRILEALRTRIRYAIKNHCKSQHTKMLVGCEINFLIHRLESQFKPGMTWENYGVYGWHIDHIKPCAAFDLSDTKQQKLCFHYSNLQPLWAKENLQKGFRHRHVI